MCYTIIYDENSGNLLHYVSVERKSLFFWPLGPGFCGGLEWGMGLVLKNHSLYITSLRYLSRVVYHTHVVYIIIQYTAAGEDYTVTRRVGCPV